MSACFVPGSVPCPGGDRGAIAEASEPNSVGPAIQAFSHYSFQQMLMGPYEGPGPSPSPSAKELQTVCHSGPCASVLSVETEKTNT